MTEHTPLPWEVRPYVAGGWPIHAKQGPVTVCPAIAHGEADASFIVKACNMHEPLIEIAIVLRNHLSLFCGPDDEIANQIFSIADETIAKAREATP
jgi:hypothetical protein